MLRKIKYILGVAAGSALVASCGGSPTPTPTPTPTATPTPTPTPTPTSAPTLLDFAADFASTSGLIYIYADFTPTGGTSVFSDASRLSGLGSVNYVISPEAVAYNFSTLEAAVEFAGSELFASSATMRTYVRGDEALTMEIPFNNVLRVNYQRNDPFISATVPGTLRSSRVTLFGNAITATTAVDSVLTYDGSTAAVGGIRGTTPSMIVEAPDSVFTITPGTGLAITGTVKLFENVSTVLTQKANLAFAGTVGTNGTLSGTITDTASGFSGNFGGAMAGPNREELALVFSVTHADGRRYVGSYIGNGVTPAP